MSIFRSRRNAMQERDQKEVLRAAAAVQPLWRVRGAISCRSHVSTAGGGAHLTNYSSSTLMSPSVSVCVIWKPTRLFAHAVMHHEIPDATSPIDASE